MLILIVWLHFISDFLLQTDKMALNKSKSIKWLSIHIVAYSSTLFLFLGWKYALVNGILHWITDFITSKGTTALWLRNERHWFFVIIGVDQAIHMTCLILTMPLINHFLVSFIV